ncbi:MAG: hypothetical protein OEX00_03455, partial [Gammaproteobacteria bacterium]|nr:hypothetical protein [Gammaproteobacteria bacterium]
RNLSSVTGLPVFGAVGIVRTEKEIRLRMIEVISFLAMLGLLVVLFGIASVFQSPLRDLVSLVITVGG